jgi:hypothetical protein
LPRHQVSTLTIDESLSLRVGGQMDGEVGFSDLNCADLAISSLPYLTCFSRLAIAIWKDDERKGRLWWWKCEVRVDRRPTHCHSLLLCACGSMLSFLSAMLGIRLLPLFLLQRDRADLPPTRWVTPPLTSAAKNIGKLTTTCTLQLSLTNQTSI